VVLGAFINAINSDLRRRARKRKLRGRLQTGSLTVVQRFGSSLNLNVHFHVIAMDGLYAKQPDGSILFHPLPAPSDEDIARLALSLDICGCDSVKAEWRLKRLPAWARLPARLSRRTLQEERGHAMGLRVRGQSCALM